MTEREPVTPWAEYQRSEWARIESAWADELRAPDTDAEPPAPTLRVLPARRDARLVILAFVGMGVIGALAWAMQR